MCKRATTSLLLALIGLAWFNPSTGYAMTTSELQEHLAKHVNERMYQTCKRVVLTKEDDNTFRGYIEFVNGVKDDIVVHVSGNIVEYTSAGPARPSVVAPQPDALQTRLAALEAEVVRLRTLCQQVGVNPDPSRPATNSSGFQTDDTPTLRNEDRPFTSRMYDRIREGMSYQAVRHILGADGDRIAHSQSDSEKNEIRVWVNPDDSHICVVFRNGSVLVKAQADLPEMDPAPAQPEAGKS